MKNFVGNSDFGATESSIRSLFETYGKVERLNLVTDHIVTAGKVLTTLPRVRVGKHGGDSYFEPRKSNGVVPWCGRDIVKKAACVVSGE